MDNRISRFIARHHVLTLATSADNCAWCANLFYAFDKEAKQLIFLSSPDTTHIAQATANPTVACSIVLESRIVARLQGAQICGQLSSAKDDPQCRKLFVKRFPYAALSTEPLWKIDIQTVKYTDNTLGFGTKLHYTCL